MNTYTRTIGLRAEQMERLSYVHDALAMLRRVPGIFSIQRDGAENMCISGRSEKVVAKVAAALKDLSCGDQLEPEIPNLNATEPKIPTTLTAKEITRAEKRSRRPHLSRAFLRESKCESEVEYVKKVEAAITAMLGEDPSGQAIPKQAAWGFEVASKFDVDGSKLGYCSGTAEVIIKNEQKQDCDKQAIQWGILLGALACVSV